jgi:Ala-tRNA(Pro) deacylase
VTIPSSLKAHLEKTHTNYSLVSHPPARSSQYAASLLHISGKEIAKSVVLRAGEQMLIAVLPASYHINLKTLSSLVGAPTQLPGEQECYKLFPDCQPGAVPPFGEIYGLPVYLDSSMAEDREVIFCAGTLSEGIRMTCTDFVRLVKPKICSFAEEGEISTGKTPWDIASFESGGGK